MTDPPDCRIDPTVVAALYVQHADELRAFLLGVLRDGHLAADVLQATFVKAIEQGHTAHEESLKSWLFQVAYREALLVKRRQGVHERAVRRVAGEENCNASNWRRNWQSLTHNWPTPAAIASRKPTSSILR